MFVFLCVALIQAGVRSLPCDYELVVTGRWPGPTYVHQHQNKYPYDDHKDVQKYTMKAEPRGIAIIINNKNFINIEEPRTGTDVDAAALVKLFTYLGFLTKCYKDLSADQMRNVLEEAANLDHKHYDCVLVAVLSHGSQKLPQNHTNESLNELNISLDTVSGIDDEFMRVSELVQLFVGNVSLHGKPKVFFIQACRGDMEDSGAGEEVDETDSGLLYVKQLYFISHSFCKVCCIISNTRQQITLTIPIHSKATYLSIAHGCGLVMLRSNSFFRLGKLIAGR